MLIRFNFLKSNILSQRKRKLRFHAGLVYILIWSFTLYMMVSTYRSNVFIASTYKKEIENLRKELDEVNINYLRVRNLYRKRQKQEATMKDLTAGAVRPAFLLRRLVTIAEQLPSNMWAEEIQFSAHKDNQMFNFKGVQILTLDDLDNNPLHRFDSSLRQTKAFQDADSKIQIDKFKVNRLGQDFLQKFTLTYRWRKP